MFNRRDFLIKSALLSSSGLFAQSAFTSSHFTSLLESMSPSEILDISPIIELSSFTATTEISGDIPDEAHQVFWDKEGFIAGKGGYPRANETVDVVIVGGGLAGLAAAYHLQEYNTVMIEGNPRLGGNAKVEKFQNTYMSLGSAYITVPDEGGLIESYLKDIGVNDKFRKVPNDKHPILFRGEFVEDFWKGSTDPQKASEFEKVYKKLMDISENHYPDLPLVPGMEIDREYLNKLDLMTLDGWVKNEFGSIHPHIEEYFHQYCWSSFSSSYHEISAAQFLNFFTSDLAGTQALAGGNGMIAAATYDKIKNGPFRVESHSFVADISEQGEGVYICYYDNKTRKLKAIHAKKCIVAAPKLVSKFIISDIPKPQYEAMDDIIYHAYLVANVLFKNHLEPKHYDVYSLIGEAPESEYEGSKERVFSDITYAHWANEDEAKQSAVTLYLPLPYAMAQQYLFSPTLYDKYERRIQAALDAFLEKSGKSWDDVEGIRLTRYGHSVAVAQTGMIANGKLEKAHAPIKNKIFFANQDNWANPCFETSYITGAVAAYQATGRELPV